MATKKDLVEAYSYSRRRLITAFVSGAPGGREVEPAKPGRTIVGGLAIGVLLVAGAAIASILAPTTPSDWKDVGLIISKDTGQPYVILEKSDNPVLRPVANITSARLILGPQEGRPESISQEAIGQEQKGPAIGIIGAPDSVPTTDELVETGWTACTGADTGLATEVSTESHVSAAPGQAVLVANQGRYYVIAQAAQRTGELARAYSFKVPANDQADKMLGLLGLGPRAGAQEVPDNWLTLFPAGGDLDFSSFQVDQVGDPSPSAGEGEIPADARIGDYVVVGDGEFAYLLTVDGLAVLDPWSLTVYSSSRVPGPGRTQPREIPVSSVPGGRQVDPAFVGTDGKVDAHWPDGVVEPVVGEYCAELDTRAGQAPLVTLTRDPRGDASSEGVDLGERRVTIQPGRGAYVASGDWDETESASRKVIDTTGAVYQLEGASTAANLGFGSYDPPLVPDTWIDLFDEGVTLSSFAALCPPVLPGKSGGDPCATVG